MAKHSKLHQPIPELTKALSMKIRCGTTARAVNMGSPYKSPETFPLKVVRAHMRKARLLSRQA